MTKIRISHSDIEFGTWIGSILDGILYYPSDILSYDFEIEMPNPDSMFYLTEGGVFIEIPISEFWNGIIDAYVVDDIKIKEYFL